MSQANDLKNAFDEVQYCLSRLVREDLRSITDALVDLEISMGTLDSVITDSKNKLAEYDDYCETMELAFLITRLNVEKLAPFKAYHGDIARAAPTEQLELEL
jgi:hypothetical protein